MISFSGSCLAQNDFSASWNEHVTDETVEENPFGGGFTITNVGSNTIPANDTIWYGYLIDGDKVDLDLESGLVSGQVLSEEFAPGDEIAVVNNFYWPMMEPGITIEFCATVFGIGIESHTDVFFTGDDDPTNNADCIYAVLPDFTSNLSENEKIEEFSFHMTMNQLVIVNPTTLSHENVELKIFNISGNLVHTTLMNASPGLNHEALPNLSLGVYFVQLNLGKEMINQKLIVQ